MLNARVKRVFCIVLDSASLELLSALTFCLAYRLRTILLSSYDALAPITIWQMLPHEEKK